MSSFQMPSGSNYLCLAPDAHLKLLEFPSVYHVSNDELYDVDSAGFEELSRCNGTLTVADSSFPMEFLEFCLAEGIIKTEPETAACRVDVGRNEVPSLRYLLLEVTDRCNLTCRHCYLGDGGNRELPVEAIETMLDRFDEIGGLRLMVSGGEPLMHGHFEEINSLVSERSFRSILMTNGTLIDEETAPRILFNEIQVSIDGMKDGHDALRGPGSFDKVIAGAEILRRSGKELSVASMVHRENLSELDDLEALVRELDAVSWVLDVPCAAGRMISAGTGINAGRAEAATALGRSFGSEQHQPAGEYACGAHLARVRVDGLMTKCGFYDDWEGGTALDSLREAWLRLPRMKLAELDCDCEYLHDCGGGCRFRAETAGSRTGPDPIKCAQFGVNVGHNEEGVDK